MTDLANAVGANVNHFRVKVNNSFVPQFSFYFPGPSVMEDVVEHETLNGLKPHVGCYL